MPLVSAICLSHPSRFGNLQRAVTSFKRQSLPVDCRELVIAVSDPDYFVKVSAWLSSCGTSGFIQVIQSGSNASPDKLAAAAFRETSGDFIAAWSDDHISHVDRLEFQLAQTTKEQATVLSRGLFHFYETDELFVADTLHPGLDCATKCIASSLVCPRDLFLLSAVLNKGRFEHWPSVLVREWAKRLPYQPYVHVGGSELPLYMSCSTGDNLNGAAALRARGTSYPGVWSSAKVMQHAKDLDMHLSGFGFDSTSVALQGKDVSACTVSGDHLFVWPSSFESTLAPERLDLRLPRTLESA